MISINNNNITIGSWNYTQSKKPYIIAEIGVNHEGSLSLAKELIDQAKEGGANAAKFQTYKAESLAIKNSPSDWDLSKEKIKNKKDLFKKYDKLNLDDYYDLYKYCNKKNIDFLSTPFDLDSVKYFSNFMNFFKIASADITSLPLLREIAITNKPVLLSTGASSLEEIKFAVEAIKSIGNKKIVLLHCILNYPTKNADANLSRILFLKSKFPECGIGYSDHTLPDLNMSILTTSYLLGAKVIEKHFTHNKNLPGNDHYHAMDMHDLKIFNQQIDNIIEIVGHQESEFVKNEKVSRVNARRSIVANTNLKKGSVLNDSNLTFKRPGFGISPIEWDNIIGKKLNKDIVKDHVLKWDDIE